MLRWLFLYPLAAIALAALTLYVALPLWVEPMLARLLAPQGITELSITTLRPSWHDLRVPELSFSLTSGSTTKSTTKSTTRSTTGSTIVQARGLRLEFRLRDLLKGRLKRLELRALEVTQQSAAASGAVAARWPDNLDPQHFLDLLPWEQAQIDRLRVRAPASGIQITGRLRQTAGSLEARLEVLAQPLAALEFTEALAVDLDYRRGEPLRFAVTDPGAVERVQLDARPSPQELELRLRADLGPQSARLLHALASAAGGGAGDAPERFLTGQLAAVARTPWPPAAGEPLKALAAEGHFELSSDLGTVQIESAAGLFAFDSEELTLTLDRFAVKAAQDAVKLSCALTAPWQLGYTAGVWQADAGPQCRIDAERDQLTLSLKRFRSDALTIDAELDLGARVRSFKPDGTLRLALARENSVPAPAITGRVEFRNSDGAWPVDLTAAADGQNGRLRFDHQLPIPPNSLKRLGLVAAGEPDLLGGQLRYRGHWAWGQETGSSGAEIRLEIDDLLLAVPALEALDPPLALKPLKLRSELELSAQALTVSGTLSRRSYRWPFEGSLALDGFAGELAGNTALILKDPLFSTLFRGWAQPLVLDGGELDLAYRITLGGAAQWSAEGELANGAGLLAEFPFSGAAVEFGSGGEGETYQWRSRGPLRIEQVDPGFPVSDLNVDLAVVGDAQRSRLELGEVTARMLGGGVAMAPMTLDLETFKGETRVALEGLALAEVLALEGDAVQGTGILDGLLPLTIDGEALAVAEGSLLARAPGGTIQVSSALAAGSGQPGLDFALRALANFRYERLSAAVDYAPSGDLALAVSLRGSNPEIERGRPIQYNLNVTDHIPTLLRSLKADRVITDKVERRLNQRP